jgi:hypothetical protein
MSVSNSAISHAASVTPNSANVSHPLVHGRTSELLKVYSRILQVYANESIERYPRFLSQVTFLYFSLLSTPSLPPTNQMHSSKQLCKRIKLALPHLRNLNACIAGKISEANSSQRKGKNRTSSGLQHLAIDDEPAMLSNIERETLTRLFACFQRVIARLTSIPQMLPAMVEYDFPQYCAKTLQAASTDVTYSSLLYLVQAMASFSKSQVGALQLYDCFLQMGGLQEAFVSKVTSALRAEQSQVLKGGAKPFSGPLFEVSRILLVQLHYQVVLEPIVTSQKSTELLIKLYDMKSCSFFLSHKDILKRKSSVSPVPDTSGKNTESTRQRPKSVRKSSSLIKVPKATAKNLHHLSPELFATEMTLEESKEKRDRFREEVAHASVRSMRHSPSTDESNDLLMRESNNIWEWAPTAEEHFNTVDSEPIVEFTLCDPAIILRNMSSESKWLKNATRRRHVREGSMAMPEIVFENASTLGQPVLLPSRTRSNSIADSARTTTKRMKRTTKGLKHKRKGSVSDSKGLDAQSPDFYYSTPVLEFSASFEGANLHRAIRISDTEYDLLLSHDINSHGNTQWFYFSVAGCLPCVEYQFNIVNFEKAYAAWTKGMKPVWFSVKEFEHSGRGWHRAGPVSNVCYYPSQLCSRRLKRAKSTGLTLSTIGDLDVSNKQRTFAANVGMRGLEKKSKKKNTSATNMTDNMYMTLSFNFVVSHENDKLWIAHSYPFTYTMLRDRLARLEVLAARRMDALASTMAHNPKYLAEVKAGNSYFVRQPLCRSVGGHMCELVTITEMRSHLSPIPIEKRPVVFLTARVHPGEANSSWVMMGILEFLSGTSSEALLLRSRFVFKLVPMLNADGVIEGNYRFGLQGQDLNRHWGTPERLQHPTIYNCKKLILDIASRRDLLLYIDCHGHSNLEGFALYGCATAVGGQSNSSAGLRMSLHSFLTGLMPDKNFSGLIDPSTFDQASTPIQNVAQLFPMLLKYHAPRLVDLEDCTFHLHKSKQNAARVAIYKELFPELPHCFTLEASFGGGSHRVNFRHFCLCDYVGFGRTMIKAVKDLKEADDKVPTTLGITARKK